MTEDEIKRRAIEIVAKECGSYSDGYVYQWTARRSVEAGIREGLANPDIRDFLADLRNPDGLGHACTQEVRDRAGRLLDGV